MNITDSSGIYISTSVYTYTITQTNITIVSTSSSTGLQQNTLYKVQIRAFYNSLGKDYYSNVLPCAYCLPPTLNSYNSTFSNNMISFVINSTQLTPNPTSYLAVVNDSSETILQSRYGITFTSGIITITASSSTGLLANINYTINLAAVYGGLGTSAPSNSIICKFNLTAPTLNSYITTLNNNIIIFTINITPLTPAPTSYTGLITDPSGTILQSRYGITFTTTTIVITATSSTGLLANVNYTVKLTAVYGTLGTSAYSNNQICNFTPQPPVLQTPSSSINSNNIITFTINITPLTPAPTSYTGLITDPSGTILAATGYSITFTTTTIVITATASTVFLANINYTVKLVAVYGTLGTSAYSNIMTCAYNYSPIVKYPFSSNYNDTINGYNLGFANSVVDPSINIMNSALYNSYISTGTSRISYLTTGSVIPSNTKGFTFTFRINIANSATQINNSNNIPIFEIVENGIVKINFSFARYLYNTPGPGTGTFFLYTNFGAVYSTIFSYSWTISASSSFNFICLQFLQNKDANNCNIYYYQDVNSTTQFSTADNYKNLYYARVGAINASSSTNMTLNIYKNTNGTTGISSLNGSTPSYIKDFRYYDGILSMDILNNIYNGTV